MKIKLQHQYNLIVNHLKYLEQTVFFYIFFLSLQTLQIRLMYLFSGIQCDDDWYTLMYCFLYLL